MFLKFDPHQLVDHRCPCVQPRSYHRVNLHSELLSPYLQLNLLLIGLEIEGYSNMQPCFFKYTWIIGLMTNGGCALCYSSFTHFQIFISQVHVRYRTGQLQRCRRSAGSFCTTWWGIWHYKCRDQFHPLTLERWPLHWIGGSYFLDVLTTSFVLWNHTLILESNALNLTLVFLQLDMLQEENENILEKVCSPFQESLWIWISVPLIPCSIEIHGWVCLTASTSRRKKGRSWG